MLAFGGHKGSSIAFMIEILVAALGGGDFGFEDRSAEYPGAQTSKAGQFVLLIDPARLAGSGFSGRVEALLARIVESGAERLPSERRYLRRAQSLAQGIAITEAQQRMLQHYLEG